MVQTLIMLKERAQSVETRPELPTNLGLLLLNSGCSFELMQSVGRTIGG